MQWIAEAVSRILFSHLNICFRPEKLEHYGVRTTLPHQNRVVNLLSKLIIHIHVPGICCAINTDTALIMTYWYIYIVNS